MKLINSITKTELYRSIQLKNDEIVKLLLTNDKIDVNLGYRILKSK